MNHITIPATFFCEDFDIRALPLFGGAPDNPEEVKAWEDYCDKWYQAKAYVQNHARMGEFRNAYEVPEAGMQWIKGLQEGDVSSWGPLFLWGPAGVGKSHYAAATACFAAELTRPRVRASHQPQLLSALDFIYSQRGGRSDDVEGAYDEAVGSRVFVLDDIVSSRERPTSFEVGVLTRLLNARRAAGRPTIVTSNSYPDEIVEYFGEHLGSRILHNATVVHVTGENRRTGQTQ